MNRSMRNPRHPRYDAFSFLSIGYGDPEEKEKDDVPPYTPPKLPKHLREEHERRLSKVDANVSTLIIPNCVKWIDD